MYTGFGRLVTLHEIKTKYLYVCLGQELFMHNLPLTMLVAYNNIMLSKMSKHDYFSFVFSTLHLVTVLAELVAIRFYMNKGVNLEQRIKFGTTTRAKDIAKVGLIASVLGAASVLIGVYSFPEQPCERAYFESSDQVMCYDCRDFHGEQCLDCTDRDSCIDCKDGSYLSREGKCV